MKQLALDLGIDQGRTAVQLTAEIEKHLVMLMAQALLVLLGDDPRQEARTEKEDSDE